MVDFIVKAGPMMIPLILCSVWALYVVIWKSVSLLFHPLRSIGFYERVQNMLLTQGRERTIEDFGQSKRAEERLIAVVLGSQGLAREQAQDEIQVAQHQVVVDLEKGLGTLHSLVSIAPMIGLLGTVLGLMDIFKGISSAVTGDVTMMYSGISVALINTVSGLAIAIPCAFFYQFFSQRVDILSATISSRLVSLLAFCRQHSK
jgi:biopolymer transport protein ExbB